MDCLFCGIIEGKIPSDKLYEDDGILIFKDIAPEAPFHALAILKGAPHLESVASLAQFPERAGDVGRLFAVMAEKQAEWGLDGGFRVVANCGRDARQSVSHLHFHILGKRELSLSLS
ncbi:MAG: HIT domain-containing protein [Oscillospiraceae bacterium]|nr:HIT domain-containing protein [Oscillospiraceae bacterium]